MIHNCEIPNCKRTYDCDIDNCDCEFRYGFCSKHRNRTQAIKIMENRINIWE